MYSESTTQALHQYNTSRCTHLKIASQLAFAVCKSHLYMQRASVECLGYVCAHQASSTWKPSFPASAGWPITALIHPTKEATGCQDWSQSETPSWRLHPTCSFQSSDERHSDDLTKININNKKYRTLSIQSLTHLIPLCQRVSLLSKNQ